MVLKQFLMSACTNVLAILLLSTILPFYLYSITKLFLIKTVYKFVLNKPFEILHGLDACLQYHCEPYSASHDCVTTSEVVFLLKGTADIAKWRKTLHRAFTKLSESNDVGRAFSRFACKIMRKHGYFVWEKDPSFSVNNHVRMWNQQYEDHNSLMAIISQIYYEPLPEGRSPWEFVLVPKKRDNEASDTGDNRYAVVWRFHHSIGDGSVGLYRISALKDDDDESNKWFDKLFEVLNGTPQKGYVTHKPSAFDQYLMAKKRPKLTPKTILRITVNAVASIFAYCHFFCSFVFHKEKSSLHGPPPSGRKLMAISEPLDLKIFKETAKACQATINDVYMTCVCGAIKAFNPSKKMTTRLPFMLGGNRPGLLGLQNTFSLSAIEVSLHDESPYQRLQNISSRSRQIKSPLTALGGCLLAGMIFNHVPLSFHKLISDVVTKNATAGCTNVIMSPFQVSMNGDALMDILTFAVVVGYTGISFTCTSYNGFARFSVTMDKAVAIDDATADQLVNEAVKELHRLHSSTVQQHSVHH